MKCNIDDKGKKIRRASGWACCVIAIALALLGIFGAGGRGLLITSAAVMAAGLFQLFEARVGWCAVRAAGVKTPF